MKKVSTTLLFAFVFLLMVGCGSSDAEDLLDLIGRNTYSKFDGGCKVGNIRGTSEIEVDFTSSTPEVIVFYKTSMGNALERGTLSNLRVENDPDDLSSTIRGDWTPKNSGSGNFYALILEDSLGKLTNEVLIGIVGSSWSYSGTTTIKDHAVAELHQAMYNDEHGELGCTNSKACNFNINAQINNGTCKYSGVVCDDGNPDTHYDMLVNCDKCVGVPLPTCMNRDAVEFDLSKWQIDTVFRSQTLSINDRCITLEKLPSPNGNVYPYNLKSWSDIVDLMAPGWRPVDFNLAYYVKDKLGSIHPSFSGRSNYNDNEGDENAFHLEWVGKPGCTNETACNFDVFAVDNDGTCRYVGEPCNDGDPTTYGDYIDEDCNCTPLRRASVSSAGDGPCEGESFFSYHDSNYELIEVGDLCMFMSPLKSTSFSDGSELIEFTNDMQRTDIAGKAAMFRVDSIGNFLYNGKAVTHGLKNKCLCPDGWNIPYHIDDTPNRDLFIKELNYILPHLQVKVGNDRASGIPHYFWQKIGTYDGYEDFGSIILESRSKYEPANTLRDDRRTFEHMQRGLKKLKISDSEFYPVICSRRKSNS